MPKRLKDRTEPSELKILGHLNSRMDLSEADKQKYFYLKKRYEGEVMFDSLTEKLQNECIIIHDLQLKVNDTLFQIATLIIFQHTIQIYIIRNDEGDFYFDGDQLKTNAGYEVENPLSQLKQSESLLRQLLQQLGFHFSIDATVVFINSNCTVYEAPLNKPIIYPPQLNRYFKKIEMTTSKLNGKHQQLAEQLISLHNTESPFKIIPTYDYSQLKKSITCAKCNSFWISVKGNQCICEQCGHEEKVEFAVLRVVEEIILLFPDLKITTNLVYEWVKVIECKKRITRILSRNFKMVGAYKGAYFVRKSGD